MLTPETSIAEPQGIVIEKLTKTYRGGRVRALNQLSLQIMPGEAFGIVGPNGAGKTTLFGCLLAFLKVDSGQISIDGMPPDAIQARRIVGYLPERLNFDKWMTGRQYMHYHYDLAEQPASEKLKTCDDLLALVGLEPTAFSLSINKYSRGMLQRLGFAQALIGNPKYLLLDEPASGVDPGGVLLLRKLLKDLRSKGVTVILNSHQLDQVEKVCDRVAFIKSGQVEAIENLQSGPAVGTATGLIVRWNIFDNEPGEQELASLVQPHGSSLIEYHERAATFSVTDTNAVAATIKEMVLRGYPIIQVSSQDSRLERFFAPDEQNTPRQEP